MDLAALTAVKIFRKKQAGIFRILAGATVGTCASCIVFAVCPDMAAYLLVVHFLLNPSILFFCFREKSRNDFFLDLCTGYFAFLLAGGMMEWLYAGGRGFFSYKMAAALVPLLLLGAGFWCRRLIKNRSRLQVTIRQNGRSLCLQALSDSGNLLHDPYTGRQVSMVDRDAYQAAFGLPQKVRLIPYESLGCRHGLLEAVTAEEISYVYGGCQVDCPQAVLGLADHALFDKKTYQMIVNPQELPGQGTGGRQKKGPLAKGRVAITSKKATGGRHEQSGSNDT